MGLDDDTKWKIEVFRDKLRHSLAARFVLRFHVSLILMFSIFVGWLIDFSLLKLGLKIMAVRYVLAILAAHGGFLLGVYIWIEYSGIREYVQIRAAEELVGDDVPRKSRDGIEGSYGLEALLDPTGCLMGIEGCATVMFVFFALVILFYFLGGYIYVNAASFFADIVLELLLAAGLLKGIKRYESGGWVSSALNSTYWSLVFTITVALLFAWWAHMFYPTTVTLPDVIAQWRSGVDRMNHL